MANRARAKLVTIVAAEEMQDRLEGELARLGVRAYTLFRTDGHGTHGRRRRGAFEVGNIRVEAVVPPPVAEAVLDYVAGEAASSALIAFAHDVDAVPAAHFV
jgi:hypothetical protein